MLSFQSEHKNVLNFAIEETCDIAEPTKEESNIEGEYWADIVVTAESDEEQENKANLNKTESETGAKRQKTNLKEWYLCHLCDYRSETKQLLLKHMIRKHTYVDESVFECGFCKYKCSSEEKLIEHLKEHIPKKEFVDDKWKEKLLRDVLGVESDEERKENETKRQKSNLKEWYLCHLCNYRSETKQLLLKHMIRKHTYVDQNIFECGFCKYKCSSEEKLAEHLKEHIPKKEFVDDRWRENLLKDVFDYEKTRKLEKVHRFNGEQNAILNGVFKRKRYIGYEEEVSLAKQLHTNTAKIKQWFNNKRRYVRRLRR